MLGASWLVVIAAGVWAIGAIYIPIVGAFFSPIEIWSLAIVTALLSGASLMGHTGAHILTARTTGSDIPVRIPLYPLGDAAQVWPAAPTARGEALVAVAGPLANLVFAALAYLLWDAQLNPYLNIITLFLVIFNAGLATVNLTPVFPLDGGRLMRAIIWGLLARPALATKLGRPLGYQTGQAAGIPIVSPTARLGRHPDHTTGAFQLANRRGHARICRPATASAHHAAGLEVGQARTIAACVVIDNLGAGPDCCAPSPWFAIRHGHFGADKSGT
jgi:hypothetical protein